MGCQELIHASECEQFKKKRKKEKKIIVLVTVASLIRALRVLNRLLCVNIVYYVLLL